MTFKHQHSLMCRSRLQTSAQPSVATGATNINMEPSCSWTTDAGVALGSSLFLDITMILGGSQAIYVSQLLTALYSSYPALYPGHEPFCLSHHPVSPPYTHSL